MSAINPIGSEMGGMGSESHPWRDESTLRKKYIEDGLSESEIAEEFGCAQSTVHQWLVEYDIPRRLSDNQKSAGASYRERAWLHEQYVNQNRSAVEIADECGVSAVTIYDWMDRHGIDRRSNSEAISLDQGVDYANYGTWGGYERWDVKDEPTLNVHRLAAVAWFGVDAVRGKHVHHENGIKWDNRESNLELLTPSEHAKRHFEHGKSGIEPNRTPDDALYTDEEWLRTEYVEKERTGVAIADDLGITPTTVYKYLDKFGINRRTRWG